MQVKFEGQQLLVNRIIFVSPDKSITHRAIILGSIANGVSFVHNYLNSQDCLATLQVMRQLGVVVEKTATTLTINGKGLNSLTEPNDVLNSKNSGTTMRLVSGILAAQQFMSVITGDLSLNNRPMNRIIRPLNEMGARVHGKDKNKKAPLCILPTKGLKAGEFSPSVASAQVKSCLLLAGLYANGTTKINEKAITRNHTENMLRAMGATLSINGKTISLKGKQELKAINISVPGDFSTASYFIALALCSNNSELTIKNVGINDTRIGLLNVLIRMGAKIEVFNEHLSNKEKIADLKIYSSKLQPITVLNTEIATLIDEVPLLAVIASHIEGITVIKAVEELKNKESNRLIAIITELSKIGVNIYTENNDLYINGNESLINRNNMYTFEHYHDHRIAMSMAICALTHRLKAHINNAEIVNISSPSFWQVLRDLASITMEVY